MQLILPLVDFLYNMDLVLQSKKDITTKEEIIPPLLEINLFLYEVFTNWLIDSYQKKHIP